MPELPTGTVTFLFSDMEGSTRLLQELGEGYRVALEQHGRIVRRGLAQHGGMEVSTEGDSFFAVFRSGLDAVAAAVDIQRGLAAARWPRDRHVRIRMGLHTGEGRLGGGSYVGLDVHRAARIAAAGHGGQVVLSATTRALVEGSLPDGVTLRDLGTHRLKDLEQPEALAQLVAVGLEQVFPSLRTLETPDHLPAQLTSFVGRQAEVEQVMELLATTRLLTLTGPGGTGKTRLALRVAEQVGREFPDGVFFIDLAPLSDPALVGPTVAHGLGLTEQAERSIVDLLEEHLEPRSLLLVLDNFEQLLAGSSVVQELLKVAPRLRIMVTSRSNLGLYGEHEYAVPPLPLPHPSATHDPERLSTNASVALFMERARAARPGFVLTTERGPAVAGICLRLDGLPLAIELAASRVRLLEPAEILARLERHLPVLGTGGSNVPERQRTLRGAIAWSYDLLPPAERGLFTRLAVFAGGATMDAADAIANPGGELGLDTFDGLASLVAQSLVRPVAEGDESRFTMLETIREFGRERLAEDGSLDTIRSHHLAYHRDLAEATEPRFLGSDQVAWLDRFEREHDNVRAALGTALDARDAESGLRLAAATWRFWQQRGYLREGRARLEALLAIEPEASAATRAKALTALGGLTYWLVDLPATEAAYGSAVRLRREIGDREGEAHALYDLAFVAVMRDDSAEATRRLEAALAVAREVERADLVAMIQHSLGMVVGVGGDPRAGRDLLEAALAYFHSTDDRFQTAWTLAELGIVLRLLRDHDAARDRTVESLRLHAQARNLPGIGSTLGAIAALEAGAGRYREAGRLMGAVAALRETTGASPPVMFTRLNDVEQAARSAIGDAAVDAAIAEGRQLSVEEAIELATSSAVT